MPKALVRVSVAANVRDAHVKLRSSGQNQNANKAAALRAEAGL